MSENKKCENCIVMVFAPSNALELYFQNDKYVIEWGFSEFKFCPECGTKIEVEDGK